MICDRANAYTITIHDGEDGKTHRTYYDPDTGEYEYETPVQRYERFREGNDAVWGAGNWVECDLPACADGAGLPSFHHRAYHDGG